MSATKALEAAQAAGVTVVIDGNDLMLRAGQHLPCSMRCRATRGRSSR